MTDLTLVNSVTLSPAAYRDGAIVRVDGSHSLVAYLTDLYPSSGYKVAVALIDSAGTQVDTWISSETFEGAFWTGGSVTGLYHLADNKILMFRSDWTQGSSPPGYDLRAYEFDFTTPGSIPTPTTYNLASEVNPSGPSNDPKWWAGGVGSSSGAVLFQTSGDYTTHTMYWYEWGSGVLSSAFQTITGLPAVGSGGTFSKIKWTALGAGKALFQHAKPGTSTDVRVNLVTASASGISLSTVTEFFNSGNNAFGPGTPKVPGVSAYTAYGANKFVLIDSSYAVTEPFAVNSTSDYDGGLWNNIGDGYNGVVGIGGKFILVQRPSSGSSIDLYYDDGTVAVVGPLLPNSLIGAAAGDATLWVTDRDGVVYTISFPLPNLAGSLTNTDKRFSNPRWGR